MVKFRDACQFHRWARPAEKGPSLFKVMDLSESVHMAPLAQASIFFREAGCHQGIGAGGPAPCAGLLLSQHQSPVSGSQLLDQNRSTSALLQHVPEPASYQPGIATELLHVLGKAARLPAKSHKLSKPKPAEFQAPVPSTASWGLEKQRQLSTPPPTPCPLDTTSRGF